MGFTEGEITLFFSPQGRDSQDFNVTVITLLSLNETNIKWTDFYNLKTGDFHVYVFSLAQFTMLPSVLI